LAEDIEMQQQDEEAKGEAPIRRGVPIKPGKKKTQIELLGIFEEAGALFPTERCCNI
jgi:hypothetical protein